MVSVRHAHISAFMLPLSLSLSLSLSLTLADLSLSLPPSGSSARTQSESDIKTETSSQGRGAWHSATADSTPHPPLLCLLLPTIRDLLLLLHLHLLPLLHHLRCGGRQQKMISSDQRRHGRLASG